MDSHHLQTRFGPQSSQTVTWIYLLNNNCWLSTAVTRLRAYVLVLYMLHSNLPSSLDGVLRIC